MPYVLIAPGSGGAPDFVSTSTINTRVTGEYFEVLRNDVFVASTYPPTSSVGGNGWTGAVGTQSQTVRVNVPASVAYAPGDVFEFRTYQPTYLNNGNGGKRDVYRFQVSGSGSTGSGGSSTTYPPCITVSGAGSPEVNAQFTKESTPSFGTVSYLKPTSQYLAQFLFFEGNWKIDGVEHEGNSALYRNPSTDGTTIPTTGWVTVDGDAPAPTVALNCVAGGCTLRANLKFEDLGSGNYAVSAVEITGGGSNLVLAATRNGAALTNDATNPLRAVFFCALNETVGIAGRLTDTGSGCTYDFDKVSIGDSDANTDTDSGSGSGSGGGGGSGGGTTQPGAELSSDCTQNLRVYYGDLIWSQEKEGQEVWYANHECSAYLDCQNPSCLYWVQTGFRTDAALNGIYTDTAWDAHQLATLRLGARYDAQGERMAQANYYGGVTLDKPGPIVAVRQKWTPVYELWALPTGATSVAKIREIEAGKMFVFATGPALTFTYSAAASELPRAGVLSPLKTLADYGASDATDAAILGDKLYIVRPGELFFIDLDSGQVSMNYAPRGETRAPKFVEVVNVRVFAVFVDASLSSGKTRCYDLTFSTPKLVWQMDDSVTIIAPIGGNLWIKSGAKLYISTAGSGAPAVAFTFPAAITSFTADYVGLNNGAIYRLIDGVWTLRVTLASAVTALSNWYGDGDTETALAGLATDLLHRELPNGNWSEDRQMVVPDNLAPATVSGAASMALYSKELKAGDENNPAQNDERQLIGTSASGLLFVYRTSNLSEEKGAFKACRTFAPALMPNYRPVTAN